MNKQKRVVLYVPEEDYLRLRAKLLLLGKTVSEWFRGVVLKYLKD